MLQEGETVKQEASKKKRLKNDSGFSGLLRKIIVTPKNDAIHGCIGVRKETTAKLSSKKHLSRLEASEHTAALGVRTGEKHGAGLRRRPR